MRERWTDDRMDDLNAKADRIDADLRALRVETKTEFAAVRSEMREGFERIDKRFDKMEARFEKVDERFDKVDERFQKVDERFERADERFEAALVRIEDRFQIMDRRLLDTHRMMMGFCSLMLAAIIGLIATQI